MSTLILQIDLLKTEIIKVLTDFKMLKDSKMINMSSKSGKKLKSINVDEETM